MVFTKKKQYHEETNRNDERRRGDIEEIFN